MFWCSQLYQDIVKFGQWTSECNWTRFSIASPYDLLDIVLFPVDLRRGSNHPFNIWLSQAHLIASKISARGGDDVEFKPHQLLFPELKSLHITLDECHDCTGVTVNEYRECTLAGTFMIAALDSDNSGSSPSVEGATVSDEVYVFLENGTLSKTSTDRLDFGTRKLILGSMIWSSNEDGSDPWSERRIREYLESFGLSLDCMKLEAEYRFVGWGQESFDALEDVCRSCGFNPYSVCVADYLGYPVLAM
ncbi:hypothetical protein K435DRAFT_61471 [Dendrothele bispora CBS 962.96]|uniref:Uncharacterized protein n=1 Tax=Dendrothele bispora (strain CBS 962.96) TaxID=1314807 RepID=A0A4S8KS82_DENBC|nr:hypothetical protein K435DRAFT_61471 [Dendrothele bispora CBS 962.96]